MTPLLHFPRPRAMPGDGWAPLAGPAAANGPSVAATLFRSDHSDNAVRQRVLAIAASAIAADAGEQCRDNR